MNNQKLAQMDQNTLREYDGLVGLTLLNIWSITKEAKVIRLYHFDKKNKEHLFALRVALIARDLYQFPVEVEGSWWDIFCLNWSLRKGFSKVKRYKPKKIYGETLYRRGGVCLPELLDLMRPDGAARVHEGFTFGEIYEAYYEED